MSWKIRFESIMHNCLYRRWYEITSDDEVEYFCYEPEYGQGVKECNEDECPLRVIDDDAEVKSKEKGIDLEDLEDIKTYIWNVYGVLTCGEEYDYEQTMNTLKDAHEWLREIIKEAKDERN